VEFLQATTEKKRHDSLPLMASINASGLLSHARQ